jgi:hypothetical protein
MARGSKKSVEFEASMDGGKIAIPDSIIHEIGDNVGAVHVRLTTKALNSELKDRQVSEDEIELIGAMQLESRQQVVKFLMSEGALKGNRRLKAMLVSSRKRRIH